MPIELKLSDILSGKVGDIYSPTSPVINGIELEDKEVNATSAIQ